MKNRIDFEKNPEAFEKIEEFLQKYKGIGGHTYLIIVRNESDEIEYHPRIQRPCYGEMRNYKEKSKNRPQDKFPGDLKNNFPEGTPIGVAISFHKSPGLRNDFLKHLFSEYNPWLGRNKEFTDNLVIFEENNQVYGVLIGTGDIPPTGIVASCMFQRTFYSSNFKLYEHLLSVGVEQKLALSFSMPAMLSTGGVAMNGGSVITPYSSMEKFVDRNPVDLDDGMLWSERCDYNRPEIMFAFSVNRNYNHRDFMFYNTVDNFVNKFNLLGQDNGIP